MYICVCNGVTERHIEAAVVDGATRMRDLRTQLGVATECGKCANCAHQCLKSALDRHPPERGPSWMSEAMHGLGGALQLEVETA